MKNLTKTEITDYINKLKKDKNYHGWLTRTKMSDTKKSKLIRQHRSRGFDDSEIWNLDFTIANFIVARLKRFRKIHKGCPVALTQEQWNDKLDLYIKVFSDRELTTDDIQIYRDQYNEFITILKDFGEHFFNLWD